jgi:hypothetical protein
MKTRVISGIRSISCALSILIFCQFAIPSIEAQNPPAELNIIVVEGEGAINNVRQRVAREPIVRVEDENHRPLAGAAVVFTLPTEGATGAFGNGTTSLTVLTDSQGQAAAQGMKVNQVPGKVPIHVNVSYRGLSARTTITQYNEGPAVAAKSGGHGKVIAILAVIAAGAAGGAVIATRKSSSNSSTTPTGPVVASPIGITPGTGSIVGPR